jgi:hypothetical protein
MSAVSLCPLTLIFLTSNTAVLQTSEVGLSRHLKWALKCFVVNGFKIYVRYVEQTVQFCVEGTGQFRLPVLHSQLTAIC